MKPLRLLLVALALTLPTPLFAYTIYLKDGSRLIAKAPYEVVEGRAIITLPNGTKSALDLDEIDLERTKKANQADYGTAVVVEEDGSVREIAPPPPPPARRGLSDLAANRRLRLPTEAKREEFREETGVGKTATGFPDLVSARRQPFGDLEIMAELQRFFQRQGIESLRVYQGIRTGYPFLEVSTNSEASVFRALLVTATALIHARDRYDRIEGFDLLMTTPAQERAGQFSLTPEMAMDLVTKKVEISRFYLENVQF